MNKICFGCGSTLQSLDENKEGYIPSEKYEDSKYCKRCFRLIHYGENTKGNKPKDNKAIINSVNKNAKYVVFLTDFINVTSDVVELFKKIKVPKVLVISKSDIIPKNISFKEIKEYFRVIYKIKDDIVFTSNKTNLNTFVKTLYGKDEIYFLGVSNSGKSTLINALLERDNSNHTKLTTSYKENTTLDFVRLKVGSTTIIDSPGFIIDQIENNKYSVIDDEIKPITFQNKTSTTYKLGKDIKIKIEGASSLTFYFSKNIKIDRLYNKEIIGTTFKVRDESDIVISGMGFIKVVGDTKVTIDSDLMKYINIRPSITGGKSINL